MKEGLSFRKTTDAIAAFVGQHANDVPRRAVFCTYTFDPTRFEAVVLPTLTRRRSWFRTLVLADQAQLQRPGVLDWRATDAAYDLAPVRLRGPGVFHSKLIVLQAGHRFLVGIGSANLTPGGLGGNLELMLFASNDNQDGQAMTASAMQFLHDLSRSTGVCCPTSAKQFLERLCASTTRSDDGPIVHNLRRPLIEGLTVGRGPVSRAAVVSPWHSSTASSQGVEPCVLLALKRSLGAQPTVYTEGRGRKGPDLGNSVPVRILKAGAVEGGDDLDVRDEDEREAPQPRRSSSLHAKAYLAATRKGATLWFGSANATQPALLRSASKDGNVELLIRVELNGSDLHRFENDLARMFERARGRFDVDSTTQIPSPRGRVLAGYVSRRGDERRMRLDLADVPARSVVLRISRAEMAGKTVPVRVPGGCKSVDLGSTLVERLLGTDGPPPRLWERVGGGAVGFPVSVPCIAEGDDAVEQLDDLLDELAGRRPGAFRRRKESGSDLSGGGGSEEEQDPRDPELDLLTRTEHQGRLDQLALRVEMLRRRLAAHRSGEARDYYSSIIGRLAIEEPLKEVLLAHLRTSREP